MKIGNKLFELRKQNNLSQEELAEKIGVARQTISKWELNETSPDLNQAMLLSQIFKISLDELVNNKIKDVLVLTTSNTEKLAKIIINILKVMGILLISIVIAVIFILVSLKYFKVDNNLMVADSYGLYCIVNGKKEYYEATTTRENPNIIDLHSTDDITLTEIDIDVSKYKNKEKLIKDIKKYIVNHGGTCDLK